MEIEKFPIIVEEPQTISVEFFISEYPEYIRSETNANQQAYTLRGISPYAYNSKFQRISRNFNNFRQVVYINLITEIFTHKANNWSKNASSSNKKLNL